MFDRLGINAKTALPALGDPIIGIDTSADGRWILATTRHTTPIDALQKDGKNEGKLGFEKAFAKDSKPQPRRLASHPCTSRSSSMKLDQDSPSHQRTSTRAKARKKQLLSHPPAHSSSPGHSRKCCKVDAIRTVSRGTATRSKRTTSSLEAIRILWSRSQMKWIWWRGGRCRGRRGRVLWRRRGRAMRREGSDPSRNEIVNSPY